MPILNIKLQHFRNFEKREIKFSNSTTVIVGPNAAGKTNILEALHLLSTGKSFRAGVEAEMINYASDIGRVSGKVSAGNGQSVNLEALLTRGLIKIGDSSTEKAQKKKLLVNGVARRLIDFAGNFKTVLFGPWDMDLVSGSPSLRRNFLDGVLSQVDREYRRSVLSYEKGLRQRNRILWDLRENPFITSGRERLHFWDKLVIKNGDYISQKREAFIGFVNASDQLTDVRFQIEYDKSAISEARLEEYEREEVAAAMTLVGPHRDDFAFKIKKEDSEVFKNERDLATYGSRGEQRMGILWLKMCELTYIENAIAAFEKTAGFQPADKLNADMSSSDRGNRRLHSEEDVIKLTDPSGDSGHQGVTLLLDDIFSELDHEHRDVVMRIVGSQQTIITTADEHFVEGLPESSIIKLK